MIFWLDNQTNTTASTTRTTVVSCWSCSRSASATTPRTTSRTAPAPSPGWTLKNPRAQPFGRHNWEFEFRPTSTTTPRRRSWADGNFDGADIVDIIVKQPACAQFVAKRLHNYFVSDVPDQEAIDELAEVFTASQYDIRAVMRTLFMSDAFRSANAYYARVKSRPSTSPGSCGWSRTSPTRGGASARRRSSGTWARI